MELDRIWEIVGGTHICMFVTHGENGLRGRPLDARPDRGEGTIYFLTDIRGSKDDEIEEDSHVCLVFVDPKAKAYLSVTGKASIAKDDALARKYWRKNDEAWWPGRERDPNLRVIRFIPAFAELWDGPADPKVAAREFKIARETGIKPNLGENRKFVVPMEESAEERR
jgi:general stress protein 26